jgi:hypothetical protein
LIAADMQRMGIVGPPLSSTQVQSLIAHGWSH